MKNSIDQDIKELQIRLSDGAVRRAYREITSYLSHLRRELAVEFGEGSVSDLYQGHLDITHFAFSPDALKARNLKLVILFNYETFCFDAWLAARNRDVQKRYWALLSEAKYEAHSLLEPAAGQVAIVKTTMISDFSLEDEEALTAKLVSKITSFSSELAESLDEAETLSES